MFDNYIAPGIKSAKLLYYQIEPLRATGRISTSQNSGTYAALILRRFAGGWPSLLTNRICFGVGGPAAAGALLGAELIAARAL